MAIIETVVTSAGGVQLSIVADIIKFTVLDDVGVRAHRKPPTWWTAPAIKPRRRNGH